MKITFIATKYTNWVGIEFGLLWVKVFFFERNNLAREN